MLKQEYAQRLPSRRLSISGPTETSPPQRLVNIGASKKGFVAKYASSSLLMAPSLLANSAFCALGPHTRVSGCIQKAVANLCNGMGLREMQRLPDGCFDTPTPHYPMHAHRQRSFKFLAHLPHIHTHASGPLHFFHICKVIARVRNPLFSRVQAHYILISFSSFRI